MSILPHSAVLEGWVVVVVVTMAHHTMLTVARHPPPSPPPSSGENRDVTSGPGQPMPAHASPPIPVSPDTRPALSYDLLLPYFHRISARPGSQQPALLTTI